MTSKQFGGLNAKVSFFVKVCHNDAKSCKFGAMNKMKSVIHWIGLLPYGFVLAHLAFFVHTWIFLGQMPTYNQPDPKSLELYALYKPLIVFAGIAWFISIPIWLILSMIYFVKASQQGTQDTIWKPLVSGLIANIIVLCFIFSGIVEWFVD